MGQLVRHLGGICVLAALAFAPAQTHAQAEDVCASVTLSRTSFYSGAKASTWTVNVSTPTATCTWTARIDRGTIDPSAWLTLNGDATLLSVSGLGSGKITLRTVANNTGVFRTGAFSIAGKSYKVSQEAAPDTIKPTVSLTSPAADATVAAIVDVSAEASDNAAVRGVQFAVNGAALGAEVLTTPYRLSWDTTAIDNGTYTLTATARDAAGNTATATATVTVYNAPPPPPPPAHPPGIPVAVTPGDGAGGVDPTATLAWTATDATTFDVHLGTTTPPPAISSAQTATSLAPSLSFATTYYWQVVARNSAGEVAGPVWSFTTGTAPDPPAVPDAATPGDGATVEITQALAWSAAGATSYDLRLDTVNPPAAGVSGLTEATHAPALVNGTTYYWQIVARNAGGTTAGPVWSFTTVGAPPPGTASAPSPADAATGLTANVVLSWTPAAHAATYDVAFGTANPPPVVGTGVAAATYQPPALSYGKTYYWQVIARNGSGATPGPVWSFALADAPGAGTSLKRLRVAAWNVHQGYTGSNQHDLASQVDLLASLNADVIVLSEMSLADANMPQYFEAGLEARTGRAWTGLFTQSIAGAPPADAQGTMVLTTLPVDEQSAKVVCGIPGDQSKPAQSSCTAFVRFAVTVNAVQVHVAAAHLNSFSAEHRALQLRELAEWLEGFGPHRIVAGDFNMEPADPGWAPWHARYADVWTAVAGATGDLGITKDRRAATGLPARLDYTFLPAGSARLGVQQFAVLKTVLSDHHLLVGDYIVK